MANTPPFSGAGNDLVLPITPGAYIADVEGNYAKCKDEILGNYARFASIAGTSLSTAILLAADVDDQAVNTPLIFAQGDTLGTWKFTGFVAREDFTFEIVNVGTDDIIIGHEDGGSLAENRVTIDQGLDYYLPPKARLRFIYDKVTDRWLVSVAGIVQKIKKTVVLADFNGLGAVGVGSIVFPRALPSNATPLAFRAKNNGVAFTSSGGAVTDLQATLMGVGSAVQLTAPVLLLHTLDQRGQKPVDLNSTAVANYPFETAFVLECRFSILGGGVDFSNVTAGEVEVELTYVYQP